MGVPSSALSPPLRVKPIPASRRRAAAHPRGRHGSTTRLHVEGRGVIRCREDPSSRDEKELAQETDGRDVMAVIIVVYRAVIRDAM